MKRSTDRILTTHGGALEQPSEFRAALAAKGQAGALEDPAFAGQLATAVSQVVKRQIESGIDVINDGEYGKQNFYRYVADRIQGFEIRRMEQGPENPPWESVRRDASHFPEYYEKRGNTLFGRGAGLHLERLTCVAPLQYSGQAELRAELDNFRAALQGLTYEEAFLPAPGPSTLWSTTRNEHYSSNEDYLFALADVMNHEYRAIVDAGFILQVDDPHLAMTGQGDPNLTTRQCQDEVDLRVAAINRSLKGIAPETVRVHTCWGSWVGPHTGDLPLADFIDLLFKLEATGLSIEASNPRHEHEWHVFERAKLPQGKVLIPGVVCHITDFVEHPQLIADRLVRYAKLVGRENVIAGTDCGLRRVGHPDIAWAKFRAMAEGARLASAQLWP